MLGYTNAHDGQGINQWIYGRIYDPSGHPDPQVSGGDFLPALFRNLEVNLTTEMISFGRVTGAESFVVFAFDSYEENDPESAVASVTIPALSHDIYQGSQWNTVNEFDISGLLAELPGDAGEFYFRVQAIAQMFPVRGQDGLYWGENSPLSLVAQSADPFVGAADWALPYLPEALEIGLLSERMFGAWEDSPTRVEAAADIVRFALVFTEVENLGALYELLGLEEVEPWADTDDVNARFLRAAGISTGVDGVNFDPYGSFTRAAMVVMLYRLADALGLDMTGHPLGTDLFTDVLDWPQHPEAIGWAASVGITLGFPDGRFGFHDDLQNQHVVVFSMRALENLSLDLQDDYPPEDYPPEDYYPEDYQYEDEDSD